MSDHWGLRCEDCGVDSPCWFSTHPEWLAELVRLWPYILGIEESNANWLMLRVDILNENGDDPSFCEFMRQHAEHGLTLISVYGERREFDRAMGRLA